MGSTYEVHEDGTTTRNKAARDGHEHIGQSGIQKPSAKTYYLTKDAQNRLAPPSSAICRVIDHGDGTLSLATENPDGRWGITSTAKNVPVANIPEIDLLPLELWDHETIYGRDAYANNHFGNKIITIDVQPTDRAAPITKAEPPKIGDPA